MKNINIKDQTTELVDHVKVFSKNKLEIYKLVLAKNMTKTISFIMFMFLSSLVLLSLIIMLSVSAGIYLGEILNNYPLAFLLVAFGNLIFLILTYFIKKYFLDNLILRKLLTQIYDNE